MINLSVLYESFTNGCKTEVLYFFFFTSVLSGIFVIISVNPIISILFLIGLFLSTAVYLLIIGISFIGLSYLLVYVGAVSILFIFILMLINVRISELLNDTNNSLGITVIIAMSISYPFNKILSLYKKMIINNYDIEIYLKNFFKNVWYNSNDTSYASKIENELKYFSNDNSTLFVVTSNIWDGYLWETLNITSIGNIMYTSCMIWLIMTSVIILLAMIGGIVITIKQKN